jgi:hypothetical protein
MPGAVQGRSYGAALGFPYLLIAFIFGALVMLMVNCRDYSTRDATSDAECPCSAAAAHSCEAAARSWSEANKRTRSCESASGTGQPRAAIGA